MNDPATSLAAVMRSGLKSRASIEPETSMASMMSMPSVLVRTFCSTSCGRASATTSSAKAVYDEINQLEKSKIEVMEHISYHELFLTWALAALGLLFAEFLLSNLVLKRIP